MKLLKFVLEMTYFRSGGKVLPTYIWHGYGQSLSPIVVYIFMADFEAKIISTALVAYKLRLWKHYIDDGICIIMKG